MRINPRSTNELLLEFVDVDAFKRTVKANGWHYFRKDLPEGSLHINYKSTKVVLHIKDNVNNIRRSEQLVLTNAAVTKIFKTVPAQCNREDVYPLISDESKNFQNIFNYDSYCPDIEDVKLWYQIKQKIRSAVSAWDNENIDKAKKRHKKYREFLKNTNHWSTRT